jgi:hypothetical protein
MPSGKSPPAVYALVYHTLTLWAFHKRKHTELFAAQPLTCMIHKFQTHVTESGRNIVFEQFRLPTCLLAGR